MLVCKDGATDKLGWLNCNVEGWKDRVVAAVCDCDDFVRSVRLFAIEMLPVFVSSVVGRVVEVVLKFVDGKDRALVIGCV